MNNKTYQIAIIGGGPAGMMAAVAAGERLGLERGGKSRVVLIDGGKRLGDKIYATGNGRCNLTNLHQGAECYYTDSGVDPYAFLPERCEEWLIDFFEEMGISLHARDGYVYPQTDQAQTIAEALVRRVRRLGIEVCSGWRVQKIDGVQKTGEGTAEGSEYFRNVGRADDKEMGTEVSSRFELYCQETSTGRKMVISSRKVILCCGGMVSKAYGCLGDGYGMARAFGHTVVKPSPALCALRSSAPHLKMLSGVREDGTLTLVADGKPLRAEKGSIQLTDYGISGIPAFQVSHLAARALEKGQKVTAVLDFLSESSLPGSRHFSQNSRQISARSSTKETERTSLVSRLADQHLSQAASDDTLRDIFLGAANDRIISWLLTTHNLAAEKKFGNLGTPEEAAQVLRPLFADLTRLSFPITAVNPYTQAQVTAGGIRLDEVDPATMQSLRHPDLYLAGELLDADGICGGYNLTFAMETGYRAGLHAAKAVT